MGEKERAGQSSAGKEKAESKPSASSFLAGFPKARYDRDAALKVLPLSLIFVLMIVSNQLCLKYVEVSFYNVARYEGPLFVDGGWGFAGQSVVRM